MIDSVHGTRYVMPIDSGHTEENNIHYHYVLLICNFCSGLCI